MSKKNKKRDAGLSDREAERGILLHSLAEEDLKKKRQQQR